MGSQKRGVSLHGSSVKGTWRGAQFGQPVRSTFEWGLPEMVGRVASGGVSLSVGALKREPWGGGGFLPGTPKNT
jgi:hypothetical protein